MDGWCRHSPARIRWPDAVPIGKSVVMPIGKSFDPRTALWALRAGVAGTAALVGPALVAAGDGRTDRAAWPAVALWWAMVAVQVVAVMVPGAMGLTALRMLAPAGVVAAAGALVGGASTGAGVAALAVAMVTTAIAFSAEAGEALVQGAAYGHERRLPLRMPVAHLPAAVVAWIMWCAALVWAVLLLGARMWVLGAITAAAAVGLTWLFARRLHRFSRRWLVLVPAGVVLHDHVVLGETLMVPKANVHRVALAYADTQALDLSGPAAGHALQVTVSEMVTILLAATRGEPKGKAVHAGAFLIAPSRPGRALNALGAAGLPVA